MKKRDFGGRLCFPDPFGVGIQQQQVEQDRSNPALEHPHPRGPLLTDWELLVTARPRLNRASG